LVELGELPVDKELLVSLRSAAEGTLPLVEERVFELLPDAIRSFRYDSLIVFVSAAIELPTVLFPQSSCSIAGVPMRRAQHHGTKTGAIFSSQQVVSFSLP
jgi:hypothetical protein